MKLRTFPALAIVASIVISTMAMFSATAVHAAGASLYLSPTGGTFAIGDTFTVSIYVNTNGQAVNAVQADISFPPNILQVVSPSSGKSFIQTYVTQPTYSNSQGNIHIAGAVPNPGITTNAGLISTVTFRVTATGNATIKFLDTSKVLLNDGQGTDILSQTSDGIYSLTLPPPAGPIVTSPTNVDQNTWYATNAAIFQWSGDPGVQGYSYILNDNPVDVPADVSQGLTTNATYKNLTDGIYYFHIKAIQNGSWGGVTNFEARIDNTPPATFQIQVTPDTTTSNRTPIIQFQTTDAVSGVDHYELKVIPLDLPAAQASQNTTPFFIEATSPYTQTLPLGRYDVVVRAYDVAGNYYQATQQIAIVNPLFQIIEKDGIRIGGSYTMPWWLVILIMLLIIVALALVFIFWRRAHNRMQRQLEDGVMQNPAVQQKIAELKQKQKEYNDLLKKLSVVLVLIGGSWLLANGVIRPAHAATSTIAAPAPTTTITAAPGTNALLLSPPIVNLYPTSISNNEVVYVGGWANVPNAKVTIYIEQSETGNAFSGDAQTDAQGNWFYSFPQFLTTGHYSAWATVTEGGAVSQPSARVDITVSPTALQIGNARFGYQDIYFILFLIFLLIALGLVIAIVYHNHHFRVKRAKLENSIHEAEESVRRGFSILRRDIEDELATVQKAKLDGPLSVEEKYREEKLMKDLNEISGYVGKEVWKVEQQEKSDF